MYGKYGMLKYCNEILNDIKMNETFKYYNEIGIWNAIIQAHGRNVI